MCVIASTPWARRSLQKVSVTNIVSHCSLLRICVHYDPHRCGSISGSDASSPLQIMGNLEKGEMFHAVIRKHTNFFSRIVCPATIVLYNMVVLLFFLLFFLSRFNDDLKKLNSHGSSVQQRSKHRCNCTVSNR